MAGIRMVRMMVVVVAAEAMMVMTEYRILMG